MDRVYVGGTFDLFHPGHVELLRRASEYGEVWVSLNTDAFAERYKRRPIMSLAERTAMVSACRYVHGVIPNFGNENSRLAIAQVKPRWIVHGDDWTGVDLMNQMGLTEGWMAEWGCEFLYLPYSKGISSREIEQRVLRQRSFAL